MRTFDDILAEHPLTEEEQRTVQRLKADMMAEVRAYRLRELREEAGLTQAQLGRRIGVGQRQISKIERGDLEHAQVGTIRKYLEAVGGKLSMDYILGDTRVRLA